MRVITLYEYLRQNAELHPDKIMLGNEIYRLTALEVLSLSEHMAGRFLAAGINNGDLVALRTQRSVFSCLAIFALRALGATVVLTDPRQAPLACVAETGLDIPIAATVERTDDTTFTVTTSTGRHDYDLFKMPPARLAPIPRDPDEPAFIIFTSGSTGVKKALVLSESSQIHNLIDSEPLGYYFKNDIALGALPMDHIFGLVLLCGMAVLGYSLHIPKDTDLASIMKAIETFRVTRMNGVPSLYLAMCAQADKYDLSSLRAGFIAGAPVSSEQFGYIEDTLGMTLVSVYGMSESVGISCSSWRDPREVRAHGVGPFYPMNTGALLDDDGNEVEQGCEGEICVKGPMRMLGYWGQPLAKDEWFHTGDLGYLCEDGVLHITGRKKDIIIRNGNNLMPVRIEKALTSVPGVTGAAVLGLPDKLHGEVPAAMVVSELSPEEIIEAVSNKLNKNEIPVLVRAVRAMPMTASGKPDKKKIKELLM